MTANSSRGPSGRTGFVAFSPGHRPAASALGWTLPARWAGLIACYWLGGRKMKLADQYHKWVEWSEEDDTYLGKCPDLITGIHGDDPVKLYAELHDVVEDVLRHFEAAGRSLPAPRVQPIQDVA